MFATIYTTWYLLGGGYQFHLRSGARLGSSWFYELTCNALWPSAQGHALLCPSAMAPDAAPHCPQGYYRSSPLIFACDGGRAEVEIYHLPGRRDIMSLWCLGALRAKRPRPPKSH